MRTSLIAGLAAVAVAATSQISAAAGTRSNHTCTFTLTAKAAEIAVISGNPPQSGSNTAAATVDGTLCGHPLHGAFRDVNHFPKLGSYNGVAIVFTPDGSIRVHFAGTASVDSDHNTILRGATTIIGGTALYAGTTGSGTDTGRQPANSPVTTHRLTGKLEY